jgi:hypothetical protein
MQACLLKENLGPVVDKEWYDLRYFYFEAAAHVTSVGSQRRRWHSYIANSTRSLDTSPWYRAISDSQNPTERGYLAEHVCLATIRRNGLAVVDIELNRPLTTEMSQVGKIPSVRVQSIWRTDCQQGITLQPVDPFRA